MIGSFYYTEIWIFPKRKIQSRNKGNLICFLKGKKSSKNNGRGKKGNYKAASFSKIKSNALLHLYIVSRSLNKFLNLFLIGNKFTKNFIKDESLHNLAKFNKLISLSSFNLRNFVEVSF